MHPKSGTKYAADARGGLTVISALVLPIALIIIGWAVDYGNLFLIRTELQAAADGGAIQAAKNFALKSNGKAAFETAVQEFVDLNVKAENDALSVTTSIDASKQTVTVVVKRNWTPFFAQLLDSSITPVVATATALYRGTQNLCILTLDPHSSKALHLDKNAQVVGNDCAIYSDSDDLEGLRLDQNSSIKAGEICSVGGVLAKTRAIEPPATSNCPVVADPLLSRRPPDFSGCDYKNIVVKDEVKNLLPGTYCGGLTITGTSTVRFEPGTYVIKDGPFTIDGAASVTGTDVGFYLTGTNNRINFNKGNLIRFSGPEKGGLAGILIFQDRASSQKQSNVINSGAVRELTGTIYLPNGKLLIDPNATVAEESAYTAIVVYRLELTEGPVLVLKTDYGSTAVPVPEGIKSTGQIVITQ